MRKIVMFDRKKGLLGIRRMAWKNEEKELGVNKVVDIVDPIEFNKGQTMRAFGDAEYDWHSLPCDDPRVQYISLFDVIEGGEADWYYGIQSGNDNTCVDEAYIENPHEVFRQIRRIFGYKGRDC